MNLIHTITLLQSFSSYSWNNQHNDKLAFQRLSITPETCKHENKVKELATPFKIIFL